MHVYEVAVAVHQRTLEDFVVLEVQLARISPKGGENLPEELHLFHARWQVLEIAKFRARQDIGDNVEVFAGDLVWLPQATVQVPLHLVLQNRLLPNEQAPLLTTPVDIAEPFFELVYWEHPGEAVLGIAAVDLSSVLVGETVLPGVDELRVDLLLPADRLLENEL